MESNESDWLDRAESILDQLLKFTAQLAELEKDPQVDARALSIACVKRLDDLKQLIPQQLESLPEAAITQILEKMQNLYSRTQVCLEILEKKNNRVSAKLQCLSRKREGVMAYTTRRDPNPSISGQINRRPSRLLATAAQIWFYPLVDHSRLPVPPQVKSLFDR